MQKSRKENDLTGKELARLINVSQQQISRYELGVTPLTLAQLNKLLRTLNKSWAEFFLYLEMQEIN
ncbi:helix-turn-helix domain-containing protein [Providencia sp. PROV197]|uniref:helix-turn-helix domain-containing protein n=1 Tax=Providencia sp. PROV197 TaxID=2949898 RepID=UPI002349310F|nr:helix-turn-helix transcriptional regulator [Providencia sp. PROV197]